MLLSAFYYCTIKNYQWQKRETRDVKGFHAIKVSGGIDLYLSQGNEAVAISASDIEYATAFKTVVKTGVWRFFMDTRDGWHWAGIIWDESYVSFAKPGYLVASGDLRNYWKQYLKLKNWMSDFRREWYEGQA